MRANTPKKFNEFDKFFIVADSMRDINRYKRVQKLQGEVVWCKERKEAQELNLKEKLSSLVIIL